MTVNDYICKLNDTLTLASKLCALGEHKPDGTTGNCINCPMRKAEGKSCPVCQMIDIKRAVILGYSVYTLRACDEEYIKLRNLLPVPITEN